METTRDRLIEAAADLVDEGGPAAVTLREVGRRAGVSHNAPYKHFAGKEELLAAVAARELRGHEEMLRQVGGPGVGPEERLRLMMRSYVAWALRHPARFKLVFGPWSGPLEGLGEAAAAARSGLVEAVSTGQEAGVLPGGDPERLGALVLAVAHGAVDLALGGHLAPDGKGHAGPQDLVDDLLAYLGSS